jgi:hypothetical protein
MDSYDTIKKYYNEGFPQNDLRQFMGETDMHELSSGVFRDDIDDDDERIGQSLKKMCCFWRRRRNNDQTTASSSTGYSSLGPKP